MVERLALRGVAGRSATRPTTDEFMNSNQTCPECSSENLRVTFTKSGGPYGPLFLPGLGSFLAPAQFRVVLCGDCGLTRFFAEPTALAKLAKSRAWRGVKQEAHA